MKPLSGKKQWFVLLILLIFVGVGLPALLTPWGFFMGGQFHVLPMWQGWGRMHSNTAGGDYVLQILFYPKVGRYAGPRHLAGNALLCTPRGEKFKLKLGGDFQKDLQLDTNGKTASFYMDNNSLKSQFNGQRRPYLELRGKWNNPDLVLNDHGSITRNFSADGTLYGEHSSSHPYVSEVVPVTIHEGTTAEFEDACRAVKGK